MIEHSSAEEVPLVLVDEPCYIMAADNSKKRKYIFEEKTNVTDLVVNTSNGKVYASKTNLVQNFILYEKKFSDAIIEEIDVTITKEQFEFIIDWCVTKKLNIIPKELGFHDIYVFAKENDNQELITQLEDYMVIHVEDFIQDKQSIERIMNFRTIYPAKISVFFRIEITKDIDKYIPILIHKDMTPQLVCSYFGKSWDGIIKGLKAYNNLGDNADSIVKFLAEGAVASLMTVDGIQDLMGIVAKATHNEYSSKLSQKLFHKMMQIPKCNHFKFPKDL